MGRSHDRLRHKSVNPITSPSFLLISLIISINITLSAFLITIIIVTGSIFLWLTLAKIRCYLISVGICYFIISFINISIILMCPILTAGEGYILGLGAKIFIIAGPVIVYGTVASVVYGLVLWFVGLF